MSNPVKWTGERKGFVVPVTSKTPRGFVKTGRHDLFVQRNDFCVDFGTPDEPAMTQDQFIAALTIGRYYGVINIGQFQLFVREFKRKGEQ